VDNCAQTPVVRFDYAVGPDEYGRAVIARAQRFRWMKEMAMAKVIEFYLPSISHKP